ncbi:Redox-sensing transcriptional repressor Rex [Roseimaritima multifibrata]|uniref:Redox-sensing transcriptional repressor Rex n=1 Tax=Roseimaritima multifibrata TaxID=1930274 RepID=A0A517ME67_9BACT|nr:redox-sensing transcriptional repressor Rex [Roseimaritima multifibrata]QDS93178.1 Redox-sensing transcriptional repressor Rex [Roseimaritima multifibrata]
MNDDPSSREKIPQPDHEAADQDGNDPNSLDQDTILEIPRAAVGRLSLYLRELRRLEANGTEYVSSRRLGELLGVSDAIVRRDLGYLRPQGKRGVGYVIPPLIQRIRQTLGSNQNWNVVLIGAGSLGNALLRYQGFQEQGFRWVAAFDVDPQQIGKNIGDVPVFDCNDLEVQAVRLNAHLAIIAVPASATGDIAKRLTASGVTGILNFAPVVLQVESNVCVANVDLASELQQLAFSVLSTQEPAFPPAERSKKNPSKKIAKNG